MLDEHEIIKQYESVKRLSKKHPEDEYWKGGVMALRSIIEEFEFEE